MASDPSHGWMKFSGFLLAHSLKLADASRGLRVSKATITHWKTGTPDGVRRRAIAVWTRGEVSDRDWDTDAERDYLKGIVPVSKPSARAKARSRKTGGGEPEPEVDTRTLPLPFEPQGAAK